MPPLHADSIRAMSAGGQGHEACFHARAGAGQQRLPQEAGHGFRAAQRRGRSGRARLGTGPPRVPCPRHTLSARRDLSWNAIRSIHPEAFAALRSLVKL